MTTGWKLESQKIENFAVDPREMLARIETRLDQTATKSDLHELGMTIHQEINTQTWKLVTFVCGFGTTLVAATYFLATHAK